MVIYLEYLFLENFLTGGLLLLLTSKLAGHSPSRIRLIMGSVISGIGGFTIFIPAAGFGGAVIRLAAAVLICTVVFAEKQAKPMKLMKPTKTIKTTLIFLALTFLSGGAAMAFTLWRQIPAVSGNGALYLEPLTYGTLICLAVPAFGLTYIFVKLVRKGQMETITRGKVCLTIKGKVYSFEALADSGNSLREPLTGRPAALIDRKGAAKLSFRPEDAETGRDETMADRLVVIPYKAVGTEKGILKGIRTDSITFREKEMKGAVLAFYDGDFGDFEVLLNREVLDEEIT